MTIYQVSKYFNCPPFTPPDGQAEHRPEANLSHYQLGQVVQVALTLIQLFQHLNDGVEREVALAIAADVGRRSVKTVRQWERDFIARGRIKVAEMGRVARVFLIGLDEGLEKSVKGWLLDNCGVLSGEANKTAEDFRKWINKEIMPKLQAMETESFNPFSGLRVTLEEEEGKPSKRVISLSTAQAWLKRLGCSYHSGKSGLFFDGHDHDKVLEYRNDIFLPELFETRDYMDVWIPMTKEEATTWDIKDDKVKESDRLPDGGVLVCVDDLGPALVELPGDLQKRVQSKKKYPDGRRALLLYQDESIFRGTWG